MIHRSTSGNTNYQALCLGKSRGIIGVPGRPGTLTTSRRGCHAPPAPHKFTPLVALPTLSSVKRTIRRH